MATKSPARTPAIKNSSAGVEWLFWLVGVPPRPRLGWPVESMCVSCAECVGVGAAPDPPLASARRTIFSVKFIGVAIAAIAGACVAVAERCVACRDAS